jgi:Amt family ammonium transporter
LAALGCFTLFFGILAFNTATLGHISQPGDGGKIALAATNTALAGASGGLAAMIFRRLGWFVNKEYEKRCWSFLITINGMFVGMVAVCGGCDSFPTWAAVVCGVGAAAVYLNIRRLEQNSRSEYDAVGISRNWRLRLM